MMHAIKFRAWHKETAHMLSQASDEIRFIHPSTRQPISPFDKGIVLMQFSGLMDMNKQMIFAGDWIETNRGSVLEVFFENGCFLVKGKDSVHGKPIQDELHIFSSWSEVIGNVHENPNFEKQK